MIIAVIVLAAVALMLGAYIVFDIVRGKKKAAVEPVKPVAPQAEKAQAAPTAIENEIAADEPQTVDTDEL